MLCAFSRFSAHALPSSLLFVTGWPLFKLTFIREYLTANRSSSILGIFGELFTLKQLCNEYSSRIYHLFGNFQSKHMLNSVDRRIISSHFFYLILIQADRIVFNFFCCCCCYWIMHIFE